MSEEQTNVATEVKATETPKEEVKVETPKQQTFTQEQLDNIIKSRLEAEKSKYDKKLQEEENQKAELLKEQQLKEAKSKADIEKIMQERLSEKDSELQKVKDQIKKEKVDNSILSIANKEKSINAQQVVALLKNEVKYNDDGRIEVVDNNSNVRYNANGELLTIEDRVKEFLDSNPHFRQGSLSGSGSQSAIGGNTVKPFNIQDLDMSKQEDRKKYAEYRKDRDSKPTQINLTNK
jgi:vacuolar-type H+-ATPase catalytic subunit A/Vma1